MSVYGSDRPTVKETLLTRGRHWPCACGSSQQQAQWSHGLSDDRPIRPFALRECDSRRSKAMQYVSSGKPNVALLTPKTSDGSEAHLNGKKTAMGQQERPSPNLVSVGRPKAAVWIGSAFCAALGLAALVLAALGPGERGTIAALQVTARFSFLLFWLAYAGGAMTVCSDQLSSPSKSVRVNLVSRLLQRTSFTSHLSPGSLT
jgi:hypothetical protein